MKKITESSQTRGLNEKKNGSAVAAANPEFLKAQLDEKITLTTTHSFLVGISIAGCESARKPERERGM